MIVKPKMRGFICTTAHPAGCAANTMEQIAYVREQGTIKGPKRVLVIGSSTGYGMACRITAAFGCGADTVGVFFEKEGSGSRTGTAGHYNNAAFEKAAKAAGLVAHSINGDAFSDEVKAQAIQAVKQLPGGQVDLVVYSLASPRRTDPREGVTYNSVIKPIGQSFRGKTVDFHGGTVSEMEVAPANEKEVADTVKVMGGEDWIWWMEALRDADALAQNAGTVAFTYIGPEQTHAIYRDGTIGKAKEDLERCGREIDELLAPMGGKAFISVNKALVTQASAAIPVVPLYISLLFKVMKRNGTHEGCIEQMVRMFQRMYPGGMPAAWNEIPVDGEGRIRMDDWEMELAVQAEILEVWDQLSTETLEELTDLAGYRDEFYRLFGFRVDGVDYEQEVEV